MRRPGPLKELPLDLFLPNNNAQRNHIFPNKRPVSPGALTLSPNKRRIIDEELFFSPGKSPRASVHSSKMPRLALDGPGSPARKLQFGLLESVLESSEPVPSLFPDPSSRVGRSTKAKLPSAPHKLAPSPELKPKTRSSYKRGPVESTDDNLKHKAAASSDRSPLTIPRDLPSLPDRHSIHHPGFDIHQDEHIFLSYGLQSPILEPGKDGQKENVPPSRKKTHNAESMTPSSEKGAETLKKLPSFPRTPRKRHAPIDCGKWDEPTTPTPRRPTANLRTPLSTPIPSKTERCERKRIMLEEELDDDGPSESDEDDAVDALF